MKPELTPSEIQVLKMYATGKQRKDIARQLHLSDDAIKSRATQIRKKLQATNATHAVALAFRAGVLQ